MAAGVTNPTAGAAARPGQPAVRRRLPVLVLGVLCLLAGLWGGLLLLGLPLPTLRSQTAADHGPLMALGFLGTVISLERAVSLHRRWAFAAPLTAGAGGVALLVGLPAVLGWALLCLASVVFVLIYAVLLKIQPLLHLKAMAAGAVCWYVATVLWLGGMAIPRLVPWLAGFLVFTILGERLELARVALLSRTSVRAFTAGAVVFGAGLVVCVLPGRAGPVGIRIAGIGMLMLAIWAAGYDVARRTVKVAGVTRFMAVCLLAGYVWLLITGLLWLVIGDVGRSVAVYDACLHAVFLGFVMSMIFGHAPVIVPSVLRVPLPFHRLFYVHLAVLHVALVVRLLLGDAVGSTLGWQVGGVGTEVAVVLFLLASASAVVRAQLARRATARPAAGAAGRPSGERP